jgi:hypothetical protein
VLEAYSRAIGIVVSYLHYFPQKSQRCRSGINKKQAHEHEIAESYFWEFIRLAEVMYNQGEPDQAMAKHLQNAMGIHVQGSLYRDIKGVIDELSIMTHIKKQQLGVAQTFAKQLRRKARLAQCSRTYGADTCRTMPAGPAEPANHRQQMCVTPQDFAYTEDCTEELLESISHHMEELKFLEETAEDISSSVSFGHII